MNKILWEPSSILKKNSNLFRFEKFISNKFHKNFQMNYQKIHNWSVQYSGDFWNSIWDFCEVKGEKKKKLK